MGNFVNLMSDRAQFRAAARRAALRWSAVAGAVALSLAPIGVYAWSARRGVQVQAEVLEVQYLPVHKLTLDVRRLKREAAQFIAAERTILQLAQPEPPSAVLAALAGAVQATHGELHLTRIAFSRPPLGVDAPPSAAPAGATTDDAHGGRVSLEAAGSLGFNVEQFIRRLQAPPLTSVRLLTTETITDDAGTRKRYGIECEF